jgi:hypothetical protein
MSGGGDAQSTSGTERSNTCDWCAGSRTETVHDPELDREFDVCERHLRATDEWSADYEVVRHA